MDRRYVRNFDYPLLFLTLALIAYGLVMIRSAQPPQTDFFQKQLIWATAGLAIMAVAALVDYRFLGNVAQPLYLGILAILGVIFVLGQTRFGAQRWFSLLYFDLQPSELAKFALIIALAKYLGEREGRMSAFLASLIIVGIPMFMIFNQPNLGTTIVIGVIWFGIAFMAGLPFRLLALLGVAAAAAAPLGWRLLADYQRERLLIFLDPLADSSGAGYNLIQSRIAIGSGGLLGQGYGAGSQSQLGYLLVRHTDFIFSVIAEELGFLGALLLFVLLALLLTRLLRAAQLARDPFGRLIATGIMTLILFQSFVNLGVNVGLVPPTGIPLPFISYGGSSLMTLLLGLGVVQSVIIRHKRLEFD
ncbi:MAG TPA: rod shape-determining protein RodA [Ardenticatenaceae bacterium]|nr:rod shape-determining protein RodA [Ardenticatenaceae bacterium]